MAQGFPQLRGYELLSVGKKNILRENCLGGSEPFYIPSKYYSCSFPQLVLWYPRHLPTVAAWMSFSWYQCHWQ